jgi:hypothetical protein
MSDGSNAKKASVVDLDERRRTVHRSHPVLGRLAGWSPSDGPLVEFPGCQEGPRPALSTVPEHELRSRVERQIESQVLLAFVEGQANAPIIIGLIQARDDEVPSRRNTTEDFDVEVDGKTLKIRATERIELRCGKASVILTSDGKVLTRGTLLSSQSEGACRIRGGVVEIN